MRGYVYDGRCGCVPERVGVELGKRRMGGWGKGVVRPFFGVWGCGRSGGGRGMEGLEGLERGDGMVCLGGVRGGSMGLGLVVADG